MIKYDSIGNIKGFDKMNYNYIFNCNYSCDLQINRMGPQLLNPKQICDKEYKPLKYSDSPIIFPVNVWTNYIIPFISKPRLDEEHNLNLQRFLLKDVKVQYMNKKSKGHKIHVFKITDNIVKSPRFINLYSKCSAFISEYFTSKEEEKQ